MTGDPGGSGNDRPFRSSAVDREWQAALAAEDATALLRAEHSRLRADVRALRDAIRSPSAPARAGATDMLRALRARLERHARMEEEVYLPGLEALLGDAALATAEEAQGEHDGIRIRAAQLAEALTGAGDVETAFRHVERSLSIHFDNEEAQFLDLADRELTIERRHDLFRRIGAWTADQERAAGS